jgi:hypothetical protein
MAQIPYDEFSFFHENLSEWNLDAPIPTVRRLFVAVDGLRQLSALQWGDGEPELTAVARTPTPSTRSRSRCNVR